MDNNTKLAFSELEAALIQNSEWILTKQSALQKIENLFASQVPVIQQSLPRVIEEYPELLASKPKISRGEKYEGLPWLMLDYPAVFTKENSFAVRTMFWWGNFFSVTLHLSGFYKKRFETAIISALRKSDRPFFCSVGESEWQHHFEPDNFLLAEHIKNLEDQRNRQFLKIALRFPITKWESIDIDLEKAYKDIFSLLGEC